MAKTKDDRIAELEATVRRLSTQNQQYRTLLSRHKIDFSKLLGIDDRKILRMSVIGQMKKDEIAAKLNLSPSAVYRRLNRELDRVAELAIADILRLEPEYQRLWLRHRSRYERLKSHDWFLMKQAAGEKMAAWRAEARSRQARYRLEERQDRNSKRKRVAALIAKRQEMVASGVETLDLGPLSYEQILDYRAAGFNVYESFRDMEKGPDVPAEACPTAATAGSETSV